MSSDDLPIALFIERNYSSRRVQKLVETWRVEPSIVITKLIDHFREMGIFFVSPRHEPLMLQNMLFQLRNSAEIQQLVHKAKSEEMKRQRSRHAE